MHTTIEIRETPELQLAYIALVASNYECAFPKLMDWACPNDLLNGDTKYITIYSNWGSWNSSEPNYKDKMELKACISLSKEIELPKGIEAMTLAKGKWVVGSYEMSEEEYEKNWKEVIAWSEQQGYTKADRVPIEMYLSERNEENKFKVDLYYPIK